MCIADKLVDRNMNEGYLLVWLVVGDVFVEFEGEGVVDVIDGGGFDDYLVEEGSLVQIVKDHGLPFQ